LVTSYDLWPENRADLFSKEKVRKKVKKKRKSGEAYDVSVNKHMIYIAPKPTNESRAQYSPEPVWGSCQMHTM